ncbi:fumarylacetoacetate hydrolase family protein [Planotetraspora sp. A-T 1434]|uniref:fumarylacetoacetate hydrolase family protein n=1 Tax=Planotetraspora sp. A-T 1434 TaxID=2979219 RepID=UPI0021C24531|nr:fumarylacetoacetate hydrolase family protein [Planotetraspora sp. A-T 1434]MCT9929012.1 fumarylacetoacetate hydrolase family protein [Planotetraspora sp. A-T 1434]
MRIGNLSGRLTVFTDAGAIDVQQASDGRFGPDPQSVYGQWDEFIIWAAQAAGTAGAAPFAMEDLGSPAPRPAQVFGIGVNYRAHSAEAGMEAPEFPVVFTKFPTSITGPVGDVVLSGPTVDWEAELVAVIGRPARNVPVEKAWEHVAGLTVGQDLSDRTEQMKNQMPQWSLGKSFPGFSPMGPWLVTPDEFPDPDDLEIGCAVNGTEMQRASTSDLLFSVPALIAELSAKLPLLPGDVVFTGTPGGVGAARKPPIYLKAGDELVTTVAGIGELRQRFLSA